MVLQNYSYTLCTFHISPIAYCIYLSIISRNLYVLKKNQFNDSKTGAIFIFLNTRLSNNFYTMDFFEMKESYF